MDHYSSRNRNHLSQPTSSRSISPTHSVQRTTSRRRNQFHVSSELPPIWASDFSLSFGPSRSLALRYDIASSPTIIRPVRVVSGWRPLPTIRGLSAANKLHCLHFRSKAFSLSFKSSVRAASAKGMWYASCLYETKWYTEFLTLMITKRNDIWKSFVKLHYKKLDITQSCMKQHEI